MAGHASRWRRSAAVSRWLCARLSVLSRVSAERFSMHLIQLFEICSVDSSVSPSRFSIRLMMFWWM
jgi:hypothetical protein